MQVATKTIDGTVVRYGELRIEGDEILQDGWVGLWIGGGAYEMFDLGDTVAPPELTLDETWTYRPESGFVKKPTSGGVTLPERTVEDRLIDLESENAILKMSVTTTNETLDELIQFVTSA